MSTSPSRPDAGRPARGLLRSWTGRMLLALVLALGLVTWHYTSEVLEARARTPEILRTALADPAMVLHPEDLPPGRLEALLAVQDPRFFEHRGWDFAGRRVTTITQGLVK